MVINTHTEVSIPCTQFVEEARQILPFDGLAVVLLDREQDTSQVVYTWEALQPLGPRAYHRTGLPVTGGEISSATDQLMSIPLTSSSGDVGTILLRGRDLSRR